MRTFALFLSLVSYAAWPFAFVGRPQTALGAVSGVVTDAVTHQPIEGVNIQLGPPPRDASRLGNTLTDSHGRFVFTNLAAGTYFINADKAGYETGHYGPGVNGRLGGDIELAANESFATADLQLHKLGVLAGRITNARNEPVGGVLVRAITKVTLGGTTHLVAGPVAKTDDQGLSRIVNLPAGPYAVMVPSVQQSVPAAMSQAEIEGTTPNRLAALGAQTARGGGAGGLRAGSGRIVDGSTALLLGNYPAPPPPQDGHLFAYPIVFYPAAPAIDAATFVDLTWGAERPALDLTLRPMPAVRVSGRLDSSDGLSPAGVVLRLVAPGLEELGEGTEVATTAVQPDGTFTFLNVPAGSYTLLAPGTTFEFAFRSAIIGVSGLPMPLTPGLAGRGTSGGLVSGVPGLARNSHPPSPIGNGHAGFARLPITVASADIVGLKVPVKPTAVVHGRLVQEDTTTPFQAVPVELMAADTSPLLGVRDCTVTGPARDTFECDLMVPGEYVPRVSNVTLKAVTVDGEDFSRRPIALVSGQDTQLTVTLTDKPAALSGVVKDSRGLPVVLGSAVAFPIDENLWSHYGFVPTWIRPSVATNNGHYHITNLRAGDYYVVGVDAAHINAWADPAFLRAAIPFAAKVTVAWGDAKVLDVTLATLK